MSRIVQKASACAFADVLMLATAGCAEVGSAAGPTIDEAASVSLHPSAVIAFIAGVLAIGALSVWVAWPSDQRVISSIGPPTRGAGKSGPRGSKR